MVSSVHRFSLLVSKRLLKFDVLLFEADFGPIVKHENVKPSVVTSSSALRNVRCQVAIF